MRVRVKICGITSLEDAEQAVSCGADALGFMFFPSSKRYLELDKARTICQALPPCITKVGVFVNAPNDQIQQTLEVCGLDLLQFHGEEAPEACTSFSVPSMKAFRVHDQASLDVMSSYETDAWLVDSYHPGERGGTGQAFQWDLLDGMHPYRKPLFLAGGLNAENVQTAIRTVRPYGVDVSSGVESAPGRKCPQKMRAFVSKVLELALPHD